MMNSNRPKAELSSARVTQVFEQVQSCDHLIEDLSMTIDSLQSRLQPVLNNDQPMSGSSVTKDAPPPTLVPLAESLRTSNYKLHSKIMLMKDMINFLEI